MDSRIHRIAAAGNAVALSSLVLLLSQAGVLFEHTRYPGTSDHSVRSPLPSSRDEPAAAQLTAKRHRPPNRVVLVVVDGLRADTAFSPQAMPRLHRIASSGERTIAEVQGTVPSSLAGIVALASGRISPAGESLFDFQAPPSPHGGIFETIANHGGQTFVAGPTLWTDLYGQWIDEAEPDASFGRRDPDLLRVTLRSLEHDSHTLTVVHFGCTDAAAHQHGTASPEYRAAAQWCDQAIGRIHQTLQPSAYLVVTSDHGNTRRGGHAGPEPDVLATPLIVAAPANTVRPPPALPDFPVPQTAIPRLLIDLIGLPFEPTVPVAASTPRTTAASLPTVSLSIALVWLAPLWGFGICTAVARQSDGRRPAFVLNACLWIAAAIALGSYPRVALLLAAVVLCLTAVGAQGSCPTNVSRGTGGSLWLLVGAAIGGVRLADGHAALTVGPGSGALAASVPLFGWLAYRGWGRIPALPPRPASVRPASARPASADRQPPRLASAPLQQFGLWGLVALSALALGGISLLAVAGLAIAAGSAVGRMLEPTAPQPPVGSAMRAAASCRPWPQQTPWRLIFAGATVSVLQILLSRIHGETVSLSTIDVRTAFQTVELPFGIGLAAAIVVAAQALPTVALLVGCGSPLTGLRGPQLSYFCSGAFAIAIGQIALGILLLSLPPVTAPWAFPAVPGEIPAVPWNALAVGVVVRALAEAVYLFLGVAGLLLLPRSPRGNRQPTALALQPSPTVLR